MIKGSSPAEIDGRRISRRGRRWKMEEAEEAEKLSECGSDYYEVV